MANSAKLPSIHSSVKSYLIINNNALSNHKQHYIKNKFHYINLNDVHQQHTSVINNLMHKLIQHLHFTQKQTLNINKITKYKIFNFPTNVSEFSFFCNFLFLFFEISYNSFKTPTTSNSFVLLPSHFQHQKYISSHIFIPYK